MSSPVANEIQRKLDELLALFERLERRLDEIAADVDALDRYNRPYGDGTKVPRGRW